VSSCCRWRPIRENIKISAKESLGYYELKKHKPWFDEGCSELLDQRKQAKLQWLQDQRERNGDIAILSILLLHHDNEPAHTFPKNPEFVTNSYPPSSPDLALCDFTLFPKLKVKLNS
jgi:hypothetical protein